MQQRKKYLTTPKAKKAEEDKLLKEKLMLLEKEKKLREGLPHLHGWPWYEWAWEFFTSVNKFNFLSAGNQCSKSSTQIRKCIHWATAPDLWPDLWLTKPTQFWYFYPARALASEEFETKWREFLPANEYKSHPVYGWKERYKQGEIYSLTFNTGVIIYFKVYEQATENLQAGTVYAIFTDEELPEHHFHELRTRLTATNGFFHSVFTATLGQDIWRRTMEPANESEELFKTAWKKQISLYDCLRYKDGTKTPWTVERIQEIELSCSTEAEVQKRVHGKFVLSGGLKCASFNRQKNICPRMPIPMDWNIFTGTDIGSGGEKGHPAAIAYVAVRPDYKYGIVFKGWRGDGIITTSSDILDKHQELCHYEIADSSGNLIKVPMNPTLRSYDWQAADFYNIATRVNIPFIPANKKRTSGESLLNTLFKLGMLSIMEGDPELAKLVVELTSLKNETPKGMAKDDFYDATRYAVMPIPWDFEGVGETLLKLEDNLNVDTRSKAQIHYDERRSGPIPSSEGSSDIEELYGEWQSLLDNN